MTMPGASMPQRMFCLGALFVVCSLSFASTIHIMAVGDVLLHGPLQREGIKKGFDTLWLSVLPQLQQADITYGNLEGPAAEMIDRRGMGTKQLREAYTSFPMFNYPPSLLASLKRSGFDIVSTANNHSLDRWGIGINKTILALNANKIVFTGTRGQDSQNPWFAIIRANHFSIAWIACTQDTNGVRDAYKQVLNCYRDKKEILRMIKNLSETNDAVIMTPHWGVEYQLKPNKEQQRLAQEFADAGALAILGSHPHCVQPFAWLVNQHGKKTFVAYSLGNFISNQGRLPNRASGLLSLYLEKHNGITSIKKISYQPTYMENRNNQMHLNLVKTKTHVAYQWLKKIIGDDYLTLPEEENPIKKETAN
jgi:hypothetical protein